MNIRKLIKIIGFLPSNEISMYNKYLTTETYIYKEYKLTINKLVYDGMCYMYYNNKLISYSNTHEEFIIFLEDKFIRELRKYKINIILY